MKNKNKLNQLRADFFKSSTKIFRMGLDSSSLLVYCYLSSCSENFHPSIRLTARILRINKDTVCKAMRLLQEKNIILLVEAAKAGRSAKYEFVDPVLWR